MIQKIRNTLIVLATMLLTFGAPAVAFSGAASAACATDTSSSINAGTNAAFGSDKCSVTSSSNSNLSIATIAKNAVNILSLIVGIIAVIMIVYGGLRYITSGGDSGNVGNAKNTIIYAIVGLLIVALAQVIVHFVLTAAFQGTVSAS